MCYICGKSDNKIAHSRDCRYVKLIPEKNRKYFGNRRSAREAGYGYCKCCAYIMQYVRKEKKALDDYSQATGLTYSFNRQDGSLDIKSRSDEWKIVVRGKDETIRLYHKNQLDLGEESGIPGYHMQKVLKGTVLGYLDYIVKHDVFRERNPFGQSRRRSKRYNPAARRMMIEAKKKADRMSKIRKIQRQRRKDNRYGLQMPALTEMWRDCIAI